MKKINLLVLAGAIVFASSCKKGENDPGLSLSSRKARVSGEWNVSKMMVDETETGTIYDWVTSTDKPYTDVSKYTVDGTNLTWSSSYTYNGVTTSTDGTGTVKVNNYTFEKDGNFTSELEVEFVDVDNSVSGVTVTTTTVDKTTSTGTWNFLGGVEGDYKNKERIILNTLNSSTETKTTVVTVVTGGTTTTDSDANTYTSTYANGENSQVWALDRLAGKEMVAKGESNQSWTTSNSYTPSGGTTTTTTDNGSTVGKTEITLIQE